MSLNNIKAKEETKTTTTIKLTEEELYQNKLTLISDSLHIRREWLITLINHESHNNPTEINKCSGAVGLTQFLPNTLKQFKITPSDFLKLTRENQLDFIYLYFSKNKLYIKSQKDLFLANFMPKLLFVRDDSFLVSSYPNTIYKQNYLLDIDHDGKILKCEIMEYFNNVH